MNWEAVGAAGEVLGAFAVVVTLVYLSVQIKQNTLLHREDARYHMLENRLSWLQGLLRNPDIMNAKYGIPIDDAEAIAAKRADLWAEGEFVRWQWEYLRSREGIFEAIDVPVAAFRQEFEASRGLRQQWEDSKDTFDPHFVRFIEEEVLGSSSAS